MKETLFADGVPAVSCDPPDPSDIDHDLGFTEPDQTAQARQDSSGEVLGAVVRWLASPDDRPHVGSGKRNLRLTGMRCFAMGWALDPRLIGAEAPTLTQLGREFEVSKQTLCDLAQTFSQEFNFVSFQQRSRRDVETYRASATSRWARRHAEQAGIVLRALQHSGGFASPWLSWPRFKAAGGCALWRLVSQEVSWKQKGKSRMTVWINSKGLQTYLQKLAAEGQTGKEVR